MRTCVFLSLLLFSFNTSFCTFTFQDSSRREMRQYNDLDDESFIGLMGKRSSGDDGDVFVGLFGRRNIVSDLAAWRRERRGGASRKSRRLRFPSDASSRHP